LRAILAALALLALPAHAQVLTKGESGNAATPEEMHRRIDNRAKEIVATYPAGTIAARTGQIHAIPPEGAAEIAAMGGNAVALIASVTHDPAELPLKRAFFRSVSGVDTELKLIGRVTQPIAPDSTAHTVYGDNRMDSFFLLPLHLWAGGGTLMVDFSINRTDFKVFEFPPQTPEGWQVGMTSGATPNSTALAAMLLREFPGYLLPASQ
jgi:hypothetical protein